MIRILSAALLAASSSAAFAHVGHVEAEAGHSHWLALAAGAAAVLVAGVAFFRVRVASKARKA